MKNFIEELKKVNRVALVLLPIWLIGFLLEETGHYIKNWFEEKFG